MVMLFHLAERELFRQRAIGQRCFAKDENAARFLVQPMNNRQRRPTRFPVAQPVVNPFSRAGRRGVRIPAGGFVYHQQMLIFKNHARRHVPR